mmetsp:Transcript_7475/g.10949  ORF Transcript_7475/g.10949 Transcript_7475/m.10949 type:complete len:88 (+) Transcript_7475:123-386(+)
MRPYFYSSRCIHPFLSLSINGRAGKTTNLQDLEGERLGCSSASLQYFLALAPLFQVDYCRAPSVGISHDGGFVSFRQLTVARKSSIP